METIIDLLRQVLAEEFEQEFLRLEKSGLLNYELENILSFCTPLFEEHKELDEEDEQLRWLITGGINDYFEQEVNGIVRYGIQSTGKINQ